MIDQQFFRSQLKLDFKKLIGHAGKLRDAGHGHNISYSRKVFIPLTNLCRDVCSYCTFAQTPQDSRFPYLKPDQVLSIARIAFPEGTA